MSDSGERGSGNSKFQYITKIIRGDGFPPDGRISTILCLRHGVQKDTKIFFFTKSACFYRVFQISIHAQIMGLALKFDPRPVFSGFAIQIDPPDTAEVIRILFVYPDLRQLGSLHEAGIGAGSLQYGKPAKSLPYQRRILSHIFPPRLSVTGIMSVSPM